MNRRTLLKGAAATTTLGVLGMRRPQKSAAARRFRLIQQELPVYEIVSFYVSDEFVWSNDQNWRGLPRAIANDGTIVGETVSNGLMVPTAWDGNLVPRHLDLGSYAGLNANVYDVVSSENMLGAVMPIGDFYTEEAAQGVDLAPPILYWQDGQLQEAMSGPLGENSGKNALLADGTVIGQLDGMPAVWTNGSAEVFDVPEGFVAGAFRAANSLGDIAGSYYRGIDPVLIGPVPFVRSASGEETVYDPPIVSGADAPGRLWVSHLADDGSFAAFGREETDVFGYGVRYANGAQTIIPDLNGEGLQFRDSNALGVIVGQSPLNGIPIPTMWVDDQPIMIADLIVPGPDLLFTEVFGINDDGVLVGEAQDSAGMFHHVVLRPV